MCHIVECRQRPNDPPHYIVEAREAVLVRRKMPVSKGRTGVVRPAAPRPIRRSTPTLVPLVSTFFRDRVVHDAIALASTDYVDQRYRAASSDACASSLIEVIEGG
jgi:hypothetical protein